MVKILGMRHGQKDGDKLTAMGAQQVFAAGEAFLVRRLKFERLIHSGANRTRQSLCIISAAMGLFEQRLEKNESFIYSIGKEFHDSREAFQQEMLAIHQAGATLANALRLSEYAFAIRQYITKSLLNLALDMEIKGEKTALVISHSPLIVTASPDPTKTPYGLYECEGIEYTIKKGVITSFKIIKAPIQGNTLW